MLHLHVLLVLLLLLLPGLMMLGSWGVIATLAGTGSSLSIRCWKTAKGWLLSRFSSIASLNRILLCLCLLRLLLLLLLLLLLCMVGSTNCGGLTLSLADLLDCLDLLLLGLWLSYLYCGWSSRIVYICDSLCILHLCICYLCILSILGMLTKSHMRLSNICALCSHSHLMMINRLLLRRSLTQFLTLVITRQAVLEYTFVDVSSAKWICIHL